MEFQPIIMAAGPGSRMSDLTSKCPKAALPIGNRPMVWYPINMLERAGFEEAMIVVDNDDQTEIQRALTESCSIKLHLDYVTVSNNEVGTADVLREIRKKIKTDILIISCDLITDISLHNIANLHRTHDASLTMLLSPLPVQFYEAVAPGVKSRKQLEKDFFGFDEKGERILFTQSEADVDETISVKKSVLKKHPYMCIKSGLTDCHLYLMKKWIVDYLVENESLSYIRTELVPHLVRKQFTKMKVKDKLPQANLSVISEAQKMDILKFSSEEEYATDIRDMSSWNDHRGDMADCYHGDKIRCYAYIQDGGLCTRVNTIASYSEANRQCRFSCVPCSRPLDKDRPLLGYKVAVSCEIRPLDKDRPLLGYKVAVSCEIRPLDKDRPLLGYKVAVSCEVRPLDKDRPLLGY
ncbi:translation initiation factor eIF-2B subunit gamma-like isoform X2 [Ostrea edulis]|uniref:translation initiation factor eIF-2B subunit gamma-like isoform X2 n=1 Tax=Ostrea edulis TaxID=37623 RepID=UPI0024AF3F4B|nr:translation initiation factor eIF-2B subunit gamma-like isoform X2 [Ostrea edulis]